MTVSTAAAEVIEILERFKGLDPDTSQEDQVAWDAATECLRASFSSLDDEDMVAVCNDVLWTFDQQSRMDKVSVLLSMGEQESARAAIGLFAAEDNGGRWIASLPTCIQRSICSVAKNSPGKPDQEKLRQVIEEKLSRQLAGIGSFFVLIEDDYKFTPNQVARMAGAMFQREGYPKLAKDLPITGTEEFREFVRIAGLETASRFISEFARGLPCEVQDSGTRKDARSEVLASLEFLNGMSEELCKSLGEPIMDWIGFAVEGLVAWSDLISDSAIVFALRGCRNLGKATRQRMAKRLRLVLECLEHTNEAPAVQQALHELLTY